MGETIGDRSASGADGGESIAPGVRVSGDVLRWSFSRSSGPGGQNVNKVSTKAELRVWVEALPLPGRVVRRLRVQAASRIVGEQTQIDEDGVARPVGGEIVLVSQSERSQTGNKAGCLAKLRELIVAAQAEPKIRRKTKPSRGSVERRLESKQRRSDVKSRRRKEGSGD